MNVCVKFRLLFFAILFCTVTSFLFAQTHFDKLEPQVPTEKSSLEQSRYREVPILIDDFEAAQQYVIWIQQAIEQDQLIEAMATIERALDFSDVNSDISFLAALVSSKMNADRSVIVEHLNTAIDVNRWISYGENEALVLKAEQLVAMRRYSSALAALDQLREGDTLSNDAAMLRLKVFRGLAYNSQGTTTTEAAAFRALTLSTMNRNSRDARPIIIFLEYLHNLKRQNQKERFEINPGDQHVLDLIIRRLPILIEIDSELAWMAAPFIRSEIDAKRYIAAYRTGGFLENAYGFSPSPRSIPLALNYGLINDTQAVEELFFRNLSENFNPPGIDLEVLNDTYDMLRSEEGRDMLTQTLLNYTGYIISYESHNGSIYSLAYIGQGTVNTLDIDVNYTGSFDLKFIFETGIPSRATVPVSGYEINADVIWERYPFVEAITITRPYSASKNTHENFHFPPAEFNYAPIEFILLGGSRTRTGLVYPVISNQVDISRRTMVSFCAGIERPSAEFEGALERFVLENGIPMQATETIEKNIISITEFDGGLPVIQYVDLDLDGRMETVRRFHRPSADYIWPDHDEGFNYRNLIASQESDWTGDGKYKTGEVYFPDGSVVYRWDMDGTGNMNYSETKR